MICGEVQPTSLARTRPHTIPTRPALARARPSRSNLEAGPRVSSSRKRMSGTSSSPIGTLSQKIQCQEMPADDRAADQRPERDGQTADAAPDAQRHPAPARGDSGRQDGQRQRHDDRAAHTLGGPSDVESEDRWCQRGRGGRHREDRDADRQQPPAPEPVAQGGTGQQQHRERQRVGIDRPLKTAQARVQVLADHRDRGRHDEVVERDHEHRNRGDRQRPPRLGRHSLPDRGRVWHDAVGQRAHGVTLKLAMKLPSTRSGCTDGAARSFMAQTPLKTTWQRRRRRLQGLPRVTNAVAASASGDRGAAEAIPLMCIQKRRALIRLLRLSLLPSAASLRS